MNSKRLFQLAAIVVAITFTSCCHKKDKLWQPNPPYPGLEVKMSTYTINTNRDTVLVLSNGTSISIPAGAMVTKDGKPVDGSYELRYREFHDAVDILLSGIPMDFNTMGQNRTLQTAGMFEIDALQNNLKLKIADGKDINVRFASRYPGSKYNFFFMNPEKSEWEWVDIPEVEDNQLKKDAQLALNAKAPNIFLGDKYFVINYDRFLDIYLNDDYDKIYQARKNNSLRKKLEEYNFKIYDVSIEGELTFLRSYYQPAEMLWKDIDGINFPKWITGFEYNWVKDKSGQWYRDNYNFSSIGNNIYQVTFKSGKKIFTKKMEAIMPLKNILKLPASQWQQRYDEAMENLKAEQEKIDLMAETYRSFSFNRLGTYNFDCLLKGLEEWTKINASFTLNNAPTPDSKVFLVLGDNSGYITINPKDYKTMRINPISGHRIIMILPDQQVGIFPVEKVKAINIDSLKALTDPSFTFRIEGKKVSDAIAFREMLGFK